MKEKIISFLQRENIEIPSNDNEIVNLFFGALVVGKIDYWIERSFDFIDNEKPGKPFEREWSEIAKQDKAYRTSFSQLDSEVKNQLKRLIRESVEGVVFSILSELDESNVGDWNVELQETEKQKIGVVNSECELHEDLYRWIELFGDKKYHD